MTKKLFLLLPPSEGKQFGGSRVAKVGAFDDALGPMRREVVAALASSLSNLTPKQRERTFNATGPLVERAIAATQRLADGTAATLPSWRRFVGVVWGHLDPSTLDAAQRRRLLIPSSLYGVTTGQDPIADFRLKMNVGVGTLGTTATYWRPRVTDVVSAHVRRASVVSLLPKEHEAAIDLTALRDVCTLVPVTFVDLSSNATVGHDAKAVKGILARSLLTEGIEALWHFEWNGWRAEKFDDGMRIIAPAVPTAGWHNKF